MGRNETCKLSDVVRTTATAGENDEKWLLIEHQLCQAKMSAQIALRTVENVASRPENEEERETAQVCENMLRSAYLGILEYYTGFLVCVSGTNVPERISRKEL